jgi:hypothetical protein
MVVAKAYPIGEGIGGHKKKSSVAEHFPMVSAQKLSMARMVHIQGRSCAALALRKMRPMARVSIKQKVDASLGQDRILRILSNIHHVRAQRAGHLAHTTRIPKSGIY